MPTYFAVDLEQLYRQHLVMFDHSLYIVMDVIDVWLYYMLDMYYFLQDV